MSDNTSKPRNIRPKFYQIKTNGGAKFYVKALSDRAARRYVVDILEGALDCVAVHDTEVYQLGRDGVDFLDATRTED